MYNKSVDINVLELQLSLLFIPEVAIASRRDIFLKNDKIIERDRVCNSALGIIREDAPRTVIYAECSARDWVG